MAGTSRLRVELIAIRCQVRDYGHPAPFAPSVAGLLEDTSRELLRQLFAAADA